MRTTRHLVMLLVHLPIATACGGELPPPPQIKSAPDEVTAMAVALDPDIGVDDKKPDEARAVVSKTGVRSLCEGALSSAGFRVVDWNSPHDVSATLHLELFRNNEDFMTRGRLTLRQRGKELAFGSFDVSADCGGLLACTPARACASMVNALVDSGGVRSYALAHGKAADSPISRSGPVALASDLRPLHAAAPQPLSFALIVGIDKYRDVPPAPGGRADAEHFAELAKKTLGLRDDHVRVALEDHATRQDMERGLAWLKSEAPAGGRVYFFFSGHGAPGTDQSTYLVPYDADAKDIPGTGIAMSDVMKDLGAIRAKEAIAFVDACFSGAGGRSVLPPGARPLMRVKEEAPSAQLALFTASQGDEISGPAPGENAGVFTKYVTEGLGSGQADLDGDGQISLQELSDWVSPRVAKDARKDNREQHPKLAVGSAVGDARSFIVEYGIGK